MIAGNFWDRLFSFYLDVRDCDILSVSLARVGVWLLLIVPRRFSFLFS